MRFLALQYALLSRATRHTDETRIFLVLRARDLQEALLIEGGMSGVYDYRFAILVAKNILVWRDHIEQDIEVRVKAATVAQVDRIYEEAMRRS